MNKSLTYLKLPKIQDSKMFEILCRDLWKNNNGYEFVDLNGRSGQSQDGVDVFGRNINTKEWFGVQCKVRDAKLKKSEILEEIRKATGFNPKLHEYYIATTLDRDGRVQETIRVLNNSNKYNFEIKILFWEDIIEKLEIEDNYNILCKNYSKLLVDNTKLGHGIGKLLTLRLGIIDDLDTQYEIMIGKIPNYKNNNHEGINYYRNVYFILNLNGRTMETFPFGENKNCYPSDIEMAFENKFDCLRISKWINSIQDLDNLIYSNESQYIFFIDEIDSKKYYKGLKEFDG